MTVEIFQKQIQELTVKKEKLEKELLKLQTERNMHLKQLQDEFGITEDKIEEKLKFYKAEIEKHTTLLTGKIAELSTYVTNLENALKAA